MAPATYTIKQLAEAIQKVADEVVENSLSMSEARFYEGTAESWSAADYLKHLILTVKPFAKGLALPHEQLTKMFGTPERPSMSFDEFVAKYESVLAAGARAEMVPTIVPVAYRIPEGETDNREYLITTWRDANRRLQTAMSAWSEEDIDHFQMPHPAAGDTTLREWLYFVLHHDGVHSRDIAARAA